MTEAEAIVKAIAYLNDVGVPIPMGEGLNAKRDWDGNMTVNFKGKNPEVDIMITSIIVTFPKATEK